MVQKFIFFADVIITKYFSSSKRLLSKLYIFSVFFNLKPELQTSHHQHDEVVAVDDLHLGPGGRLVLPTDREIRI
jgi:hypothetical protein